MPTIDGHEQAENLWEVYSVGPQSNPDPRPKTAGLDTRSPLDLVIRHPCM
jgi:hypothetical protein